jgi:hypothetical protein
MTLNFDRDLGTVLNRAKQQILDSFYSLAPDQRQALMAHLALDYRNGAVLEGVSVPAFTATPELDLDQVVVAQSGAVLHEAAMRATRTSPVSQAYLRPFYDDLDSPVRGRRLVASCALLCFLLRG